MKYWEEDLKLKQDSQFSTKAYKELLPFRIRDISIEEGMNCSFYEINSSVKSVLLAEKSPGEITHIFHFELLKKEKVLLSSEDNGSSLLFYADNEDLNALIKSGVPEKAITLYPSGVN
mgnify:FL=1